MLKDKHNVSIRLADGGLLIFSGKLLTHHQSSNLLHTINDELFINFLSDGTQRLFTHIKNIFVRKNTN